MNSIVEKTAYFAENRPNAIAVIAERQSVTYAELWREVRGFSSYLKSFGFPKGSRIVVKSAHSIWYVVSCLAIHLSGYAHVPLEKTIGPDGLLKVCDQLSASLIITSQKPDTDTIKVIDSNMVRTLAAEHFDENEAFEFPEREDICDILFTTGTTGKSKGVMESHRAVVAVAENVWHGAGIIENNVYLIPAPVNHAAAIRKIYVSLISGTTAVLLDGFSNVKMFFEYINEYHVTSIHMPPSAVRMMLVLAAKELAKYADQIDHIHTGSAAFPEADKEKLAEILPKTRLYFAYGSSEAGTVSMFDYAKYRGMTSCVGKPTCNSRIFIVDENRNEIKSSKENQGLIAITGDVVMSGYFNEPELTAEILKDGVIYTNDIGYFDEEGFLYMTGRKGDVINIGGLKIAPTEVENIVIGFPGVADAACFAVENRMGGMAPKLIIMEKPDYKIDLLELEKYMLQHLEAYKVPKLMEIVDSIPKTSNGKTDRKALK